MINGSAAQERLPDCFEGWHRAVARRVSTQGGDSIVGVQARPEVSVVPWEYVRAKCRWRNSGNLAPQEYEPWMGRGLSRRALSQF